MHLIYPLEIIMGVWLCLFTKNITNLRNDLTLKSTNLVIVMIVDMKMYGDELKLGKETSVKAGIYRHPKGKVQHFVDDMEAILQRLGSNATHVILGDINMNLLNCENPPTSDYLTQLLAHNFIPKITLPRWVKDTSITLIDHIFLRVPKCDIDRPVCCGNLYSEITDHLPNFIAWPCDELSQPKRPLIKIYSEKI